MSFGLSGEMSVDFSLDTEKVNDGHHKFRSKVVIPRNPKLIKEDNLDNRQLNPSQYFSEMSMDTETWLASQYTMKIPKKTQLLDMYQATLRKGTAVGIDESLFQPFPSEVIFKNFKPFTTLEVPLSFKNNDKVSRVLKVTCDNSPYFKIETPVMAGHKVSAGLSASYKVVFMPHEFKDYNHELVCETEREKFLVPIKAIGARAFLDFPDEICFPVAPVKYLSSRTILVRNIGTKVARFSLSTNKPFSISPDNSILEVNDSMQVTVDFLPMMVGNHIGQIMLKYDTGEGIYIKVNGVAQDALIRLDKNTVRIDNTYISMANQRSITISNRSDVIAHFRWTRFATQEEEDQHKAMLKESLVSSESVETDRFLSECNVDPSIIDKASIIRRSYQNKKRMIEDDPLLFNDDVIKIDPLDGDIWPKSTMDIMVIFRPEQAMEYDRVAYCDITGRESRLPLHIKGCGMGPNIQFSYDTLDMGNIFVFSTHTYEVVLANKGDIDAIFSLLPSNSVYRPCFQLNPTEGIVMPEGYQAIQIAFSSRIVGEFVEEFHFQVDGLPYTPKFTFTGKVIAPTFCFDVPCLKFGTVSYGFAFTQTCILTNTSLVPMTFYLRIPSDGSVTGVVCTQTPVEECVETERSTSRFSFSGDESRPLSAPPKEFEISPSCGLLAPHSCVEIKVTLCSNTKKKYNVAVVVDIEGVDNETFSLPITAKCVVPTIVVKTPLINCGRCYLGYPCTYTVELQNDTDLPTKYRLAPFCAVGDDPSEVDPLSILFSSSDPEGIIEPHSCAYVPVTIIVRKLKEQELTIYFSILGNPDTLLPVQFSCSGEGPVVHVTPVCLDWGQIPVLTQIPKVVRLTNESVIPAQFVAKMARPNSAWTVEPAEGEIEPNGSMEVTVCVCLDDCLSFSDRLQIDMANGMSHSVTLTAVGHGTTIVTVPPMSHTLNLGPHFSKSCLRQVFRLMNRGRRHQSLVFSMDGFPLSQKSKKANQLQSLKSRDSKDIRFKNCPQQPEPACPVFSITPQRLEMNPGDENDVVLQGCVDEAQFVREKLLCHAIIGRSGGRHLIKQVQLECEFINPLLEFSTDMVFFLVNKEPNDVLDIQSDSFEVTNVSSLPLTAHFSVDYPFSLAGGILCENTSTMVLHLESCGRCCIQVLFDPAYKDDLHSRSIEGTISVCYEQHPHVDAICARGVVNFPNLDFEKTEIDFGCILNDTEVTRYMNICNCSPLEVRYRWSFVLDDETVSIHRKCLTDADSPDLGLEDEEEFEFCDEDEQFTEQFTEQIDVTIESTSPTAQSPVLLDQASPSSKQETLSDSDNKIKNKDAKNKENMKTSIESTSKKDKPKSGDSSSKKDVKDVKDKKDAELLKDEVTEKPKKKKKIPKKIKQLPLTPRPTTPPVNLQLLAMLEDSHMSPPSVEETFDIQPIYGTLQPGETELIVLTFFGHAHMGSKAKAICEVHGGPTYEFKLRGEASLVEYKFDYMDVDYGKIMYDQVAVTQITLSNTGYVGLDFVAVGVDPALVDNPKPGVPVITPHMGHIDRMSSQTLVIRYLPCGPDKFQTCFQIQVAHFEPNTINIYGEGVFPRIILDLPRICDPCGKYSCLVQQAMENISLVTKKEQSMSEHSSENLYYPSMQPYVHHEPVDEVEIPPTEMEVQMEVERIVVQEFFAEQCRRDFKDSCSLIAPQNANQNHSELIPSCPTTGSSKQCRKAAKLRPRLPEYMLDFDHVILGTVCQRTVTVTNTGWFDASFSLDRKSVLAAHQRGFTVEMPKCVCLPGAPDHETVTFDVSFDPRGANLGLGKVEVAVLINIINGPQVAIQLRAVVTTPDLHISCNLVEFGEVKCGECKIISLQMYNYQAVRCDWTYTPCEKEKCQVDKRIPMHLRRKVRPEKSAPPTFDIIPQCGSLMPGERQNIQVKFMPAENKFYQSQLLIKFAQSSQHKALVCNGNGLEPQIEIELPLLTFGPILPHSPGDEKEVSIRNPCKFPIEIYNLEFDKTYLEEEKILRLMKGYDDFNTLLLPPRGPNEKLPTELIEYFEEQLKKLEEMERLRREAEEAAEVARLEQEKQAAEECEQSASALADKQVVEKQSGEKQSGDKLSGDKLSVEKQSVEKQSGEKQSGDKLEKTSADKNLEKQTESLGKLSGKDVDQKKEPDDDALEKLQECAMMSDEVGELEQNPVSAAIARYMGIDMTPEGKAARCRRGIAIIVNGAPRSGKTATATALAKCYNAAVLSIDDIIMDAIITGCSPAGVRARELCIETAKKIGDERRQVEKEDAERRALALSMEAVAAQGGAAPKGKASTTTSDAKGKGNRGGSTGTAQGKAGSQRPISGLSQMPPPSIPPGRRLSVDATLAGPDGLWSTILPDEIVVDILAARFLGSDCQCGIVIDGLESLFIQNSQTSAVLLLKALNNRKHMYAISLKLDYCVIKEKEQEMQAEKKRMELEREEQERRHLDEMSEDEYDALTEEEKEALDKKRLEIKKERLKRYMAEQQEKKRKEEEERQEELRRQEEEKLSKKKKRPGAGTAMDKAGGKDKDKSKKKQDEPPPPVENKYACVDLVSVPEPVEEKKKADKKDKKGGDDSMENEFEEESCALYQSEAECLLVAKFKKFEFHFKEVCGRFDFWERSTGILHQPTAPEDDDKAGGPGKKAVSKKSVPHVTHDKKDKNKDKDQLNGEGDEQEPVLTEEEKQEKRLAEGIGLPHIIVNCDLNEKTPLTKVLDAGKLPPAEEVFDGLGLGPNGPPIPPPATLAIVPYPVRRQAPPGAEGSHYQFIFTSVENIEDKPSEQDSEEYKVEEGLLTKGLKKGEKAKLEKDDKKRKKSATSNSKARISRTGSSGHGQLSAAGASFSPVPLGELSHSPDGTLPASESKIIIKVYRWVIPADGEIVIKLAFNSNIACQFDQTLNFEIVGTRRRYQLHCRGICAFPTISKEPRIVFPHRQRSKLADEIVSKKYIASTETFEFGPLLVGKSRDRYKECRYPENMERFKILNSSPLDADVSLCFLTDNKEETFLLCPTNFCLRPNDEQEVCIWAYPKSPGVFEDSLVCCIKENPEPVIFKLRCHGVRPELEVDKKAIHFDKILLHRKDTKTVNLKNNCLLPVAWKLSGLDSLGDDFSVAQENGIVPPKSDFCLMFYFRAVRPCVTNRKVIRLEISDVDNIVGLVQTETIQIFAEAYDVALDMSFPKGTDGGIDFDIVRVGEEIKQMCSLKNKGKYDISYNFTFEPTSECPRDLCKLFTITPSKGTLTPADRPMMVQVTFSSKKEITLKDQPILRCQVIEPNIGEGGETIASIPVRVSAKSTFAKYCINPANDINFGAMMANSRKTRTFTIENKGEKFDFKFAITKMVREEKTPVDVVQQKSGKGKAGDDKNAKAKKPETISQPTGSQAKLVLGMFNVAPAVGSVPAGGQVTVTIDCVADGQGRCEEDLSIDITNREPTDNPRGIPYKLIVESCIPSINVDDIGSIFEEHRICKCIDTVNCIENTGGGGVYGEEDRKFMFSSTLVGMKAKARFKISNPKKIPCDVAFAVKPMPSKSTKQAPVDAFDVTPTKVQIPANSYVYATVTFSPTVMQQYNAIFDASIDTVPASQLKGRNLTFEISGEGNLPHVAIIKPKMRNRKGQPVILFKRSLVGRAQSMSMVVVNDGTVTCKVDLELIDPDNVFAVQLAESADKNKSWIEVKCKPQSVILDVDESATFVVTYLAECPQRSQGQIRISVVNNLYDDSIVQLIAEGYLDTISLDNINNAACPSEPQLDDATLQDDDIPAAKNNVMDFGDCYIHEQRTLTFTMTNNTESSNFKFVWPDHPQLKFSPQVGHLLGGRSKDICVTFRAEQPVTLKEDEIICQITGICFDPPCDVSDWDDRMKIVKWVDAARVATQQSGDSIVKNFPESFPTSGKRKVVETEPEPLFTEQPGSNRCISLLVSGSGNYCKYSLPNGEQSLQFRDTLMFQSRIYSLQLQNTGTVTIEYKWTLMMDDVLRTSRATPGCISNVSDTPRPMTAGPLIIGSDDIRPCSAASSVGSNLPCYVPFGISPENGLIAPGKTACFTIKFSPMDVDVYEARLICSIPNLEPNAHGPVIGLKASSLLPYCHFEIEDSDYLKCAHRNPELPGPCGSPAGTALDPNTRVIEFNCVGIGVKMVKRFSIINPTNKIYQFIWSCQDLVAATKIPEFVCCTPCDTIKCGKKVEVVFEFTPTSLELIESFWRFDLPDQSICLPFLLVGRVKDPSIVFDRTHINFRSILIGHETTDCVKMINDECEPFNFSFDEPSCHTAGYSECLSVEPMCGCIPAKSSLMITIRFTPRSEKEVNFNIVCKVKRKIIPLTINVKAEGFCMNSLVMCEDYCGGKVEMLSTCCNILDFGQVEVHQNACRNISIVNLGKFLFEYCWELRERSMVVTESNKRAGMISISPGFGVINQGERVSCILSFTPPQPLTLNKYDLILRIAHGATYNIQLRGTAIQPGIHFSFSTFNFGACFIHRAGLTPKSVALKLTNNDKKDISLDCLTPSSSWLAHDFEPQLITPGQTLDVIFSFYPRDACKYRDIVTFEINGLTKHGIEFFGQGTEMRIEVCDPRNKVVKFGALQIGQMVKKCIPIVNNSPAPVSFYVNLMPTTPALADPCVVKFCPKGEINLAAKGGCINVEITICPKYRIASFSEEVQLECAGLCQTIFMITGSCQGLEISLNAESIPFGAVVQKSSSTRQLVMSNTGDIGSRFKWDLTRFGPNFSICPNEGYISPGMEVTFDVNFHPPELCNDIRCDNLKCNLECGKPLKLTLTGTCVAIPPSKETFHIQTTVRQKETRNLPLVNNTNQKWNLRPVIDGEHWSGLETICVPPQSSKSYELTYHPLVMTTEGKKHTGSVFFPLPDGTGIMFNITGAADPPKVAAKITREIPCKTVFVEMLQVTNWLRKTQRFRAKIESLGGSKEKLDKGEKGEKSDQSITIKGLDFIDVPGLATRDYKLTFHAYKECQPQYKVTFINEQTGEYLFYELAFRLTKPGVISAIQLSTPVRQRKQHTLTLENPLSFATTFNATCNIPDIQIPNQISVPASSETIYTFEYFPIKVGSSQGKLEFNSNDLGLYTYDIEAKATPPGPERPLQFKASLGSSQTVMAKFFSFAKQKTDYTCKLDHPDFHADKSVTAAPASNSGTEVMVEVTYEPSIVGESRATLSVSSPVGGDYCFPVFATCCPPKPQGPFMVKSGSSINISFRNIFSQPTNFTFQVDNPLFHISKPSENIKPRKEHRITVSFDGNDSTSKAPVMGRLVVSCPQSAGPAGTQWVYYLKGITPEGKDSKESRKD